MIKIKDLIRDIRAGKEPTKDQFQAIINDKIQTALDVKKIAVAEKIFNGESKE